MRCRPFVFLASALAGAAMLAGAQAQETSVRIVRVSLAAGAVQIQAPNGSQWRPAMFEAPVQQGERIRTLASGRAEIQFEDGSTLRLIPGSEVEMSKMLLSSQGDFTTWVKLDSGTAFLTLRKKDGDGFQLELNSGGAVHARGELTCRVDAGKPAKVSVFSGKAEVEDGRQTVEVSKNKLATFAANLQVADLASSPDPWTQWSRNRDEYFANALNQGVQSGSLGTYANWYGGRGVVQPTYYNGTSLTYSGSTACPWTVTSGDYKGWCWSTAQGWYLPASAITTAANAQSNGASDVEQTNDVLAGNATTVSSDPSASFGFGNPYGLGFGYGGGGFFGMDACLADPNIAFSCDPYWWGAMNAGLGLYGLGGYYFPGSVPVVQTLSGGVGARTGIQRNPPGQLGRKFDPVGKSVGSGLQRLGPPPRVAASAFTRGRMAPGQFLAARGMVASGWSHEGIQASHVGVARMSPAGFRGAMRTGVSGTSATMMRSGLNTQAAPAFAGSSTPSFASSTPAAPAGGSFHGGVSGGGSAPAGGARVGAGGGGRIPHV